MSSFSLELKKQIIQDILKLDKNYENIKFLLFGIFYNNYKTLSLENNITKLEFITNNISLIKLLKKYFKTNYVKLKDNTISKKAYIISFDIKNQDLNEIINIKNNYKLKQSIKLRLIMIGIFIKYGSLLDPIKKRYHLEIRIPDENIENIIIYILNIYDIKFHQIFHNNKKVIYIKKSETIADFLKLINATENLYYFENCRIERDFFNSMQRLNNLEIANINKKIKCNQKIIKYIKFIKNINDYKELNDHQKIYCDLRVKFPDLSMNELIVKINLLTNKKHTKSWINHCNIKIKEIYNRYV